MEKNESRIVFAKNLERHINRSGKTKAEIARLVGVQPSTISDWLACRGYPRVEKLKMLANVFATNPTELATGENIEREKISEKEQKLLDLFHQVPEKHRDGLLELIEVYSKNLR